MALLAVGLALAETRESRLAMGTIVGVTVRDDAGDVAADVEAAYAEIERWEALLSEWRPDSLTSRLNAEGVATFPDVRVFRVGLEVAEASGGAFSLTWRGGAVTIDGDTVRATGEVGLGGVLKGFLADRAAEVLTSRGRREFLIDAAGDLVARGAWDVDLPALGLRVRLVDAALSSSGDDQQPGHVRDPRTGEPVTCSRAASVVAADGAHADALATAVFAACDARLAERFGAKAVRLDAGGRLRWSRGAKRNFRR
ncbi:MAG: FAD:protein FMN transferase [Myxococcota bacterium]